MIFFCQRKVGDGASSIPRKWFSVCITQNGLLCFYTEIQEKLILILKTSGQLLQCKAHLLSDRHLISYSHNAEVFTIVKLLYPGTVKPRCLLFLLKNSTKGYTTCGTLSLELTSSLDCFLVYAPFCVDYFMAQYFYAIIIYPAI
ncbi:hypothetical protein Tsp_01187 [Trichinella spiralis]|uniref:hypothetical protein n=1 Tax=Trichinella spiralis TaxID=6334 RepID=UPI0001EFC66C|nr:hypothetical protein Tsp_01187 [Trichinella spiralis]